MAKLTSKYNPELEAIGSGIVKRLGGVWKPGGAMCLCPAHPDRSPSLSVRVGDHALVFKCFAGCDNRDVIHEILRLDENALQHVEQACVSSPGMPTDLWRRQQALRIWDEARPITGTPAEIYLRRRRIAVLPRVLRFHPKTPLGGGGTVDFRPAMIAALHDGGLHDEGRFIAIQRTFFDRDDARRARDLVDPRMTLGRPDRAAVMLGTATSVLGLAEGIETALSAMILFGVPVWATLGSERLHQIALPDRVTRLILFPDNDIAGEIGVANALETYAMPGRDIAVEFPPSGFKDWNDVLRAGGGSGGVVAASGLMVRLSPPGDYPMTQLPILVPAANLAKSPSNVRTVSDAIADAQLEANIAAKGVRQNLIGVPVSRKKGHYRIIAGGRRLDAVHRLIEKGVFDADYQLAVLVLGNAKDAIETSLEENFFNLTMNPADTCRAFQDIIESEGKTPEDVAKRFGLTERFVRSRLRLADLADPIFEALRNAEITLNVAVAYASNSDRSRQAEVFELLKDGYYRSNVNEIKRQLAEDTYVGSDPKALLVGRDAYIEAGGRVDLDLFSDSTTERWIDGDLLNRLVADKLAAAAEALREREGLAEVRVIPATHVTYNDTWDLRPLKGDTPELTAEQQARLDELESEIEAANEAWEEADEEAQADLANRVDMLEAEYRAIENQSPILTEEQKAGALAYVVIGHDGEPRLHEQLYVAPVEDETDEDSVQETGDDETVGTGAGTAPGKPAYSQRLSQELAEMKSELLRVHIASDPRFALDLGTFWMVDKATRHSGAYDLATELKADKPWSSLSGFQSGTLAAEEWGKIDEALDRSWTEAGDTCQRYDAFCALPDEARAAWLAWAVARTLHAVTADSKAVALINHLGTKLDIDVAAWWRPTANNYFDRLSSKAAILAHLDEIGGKELSSRYGASKKHDLATSAEKIFAGTVPIEAELRDAALAWVPDVMRYAEAAPDVVEVEPVAVNDEDHGPTADELPQAA